MAKAIAQGVTGTDVVTVALKHPTGIIIEAFVKATDREPVMGGGTREVAVFRSTGKQYTLNGTQVPFGETSSIVVVGGYAMTPGIPRDVWENWLDHHKDSPLVENGLICAHESLSYIKDEAKAGADFRHGLEPMARKGDPRSPKKVIRRNGKIVGAVDMLNTADEQPAEAMA